MRVWTKALIALPIAGCSVNPVPEPPARPETKGPIAANGCLSCDGPITLSGSTQNAATVWAVNLDRDEPPATVDVQSDGTFTLEIHALSGDEIRLQARRADLRSDPRDYVVPDQGELMPAPRPLFDCLPAPLERDLGELAVGAAPAAVTIDLTNSCTDPVELASIGLRVATAELAVQSSPAPVTLQSGDAELVQITFDPSAPGVTEEILLVEITAPVADRRAVTLYGRSVP